MLRSLTDLKFFVVKEFRTLKKTLIIDRLKVTKSIRFDLNFVY